MTPAPELQKVYEVGFFDGYERTTFALYKTRQPAEQHLAYLRSRLDAEPEDYGVTEVEVRTEFNPT